MILLLPSLSKCSSALARGVTIAAVAASMALAAGITPAAAQYNGGNDDRRYNDDQRYANDRNNSGNDDGSYASDQRGYADDDDEDGYEDGQDAPDVSYFYDELEDQGTWENNSEYGQVWRPRHVDADWRPYTRGTWANTEEHGWYWVSDEPFGWATYHYGRWHLDDRSGWVWVPGTRWGPAWVAWRSNDDHIGWAPLPPDAYWEHGHGLRVSQTIYEGPRYSAYWSFVEPRYITTPHVYTYFAPRTQVVTIINVTRPQTNYVFVNRRIVNRGVSVTSIERVTRTRITTVRVNESDNRAYRTAGRTPNQVNQINVFRPKLTRFAARPHAPGKPAVNPGQWRDVDRRPTRQERIVRQRQLQQQGAPARARAPVAVQRGIAPNAAPARQFRNAAPNPNANPNANANGNWGPGAHQVRPPFDARAERMQRIRERNQQIQLNRAAAQGGVPTAASRQSGQIGVQRGPQANAQQGQGDPRAAARRRQQLLQQQRRNQNNNE